MHYLITGHTGFKGSWLSLMLKMQGHKVSGISLDPSSRSLFHDTGLANIFTKDLRVDIRNRKELSRSIATIDPEIVIHLAAQPLVRESYKNPIETFETNVLGTLNVLDATRQLSGLRASLIITTDKVYKNRNQFFGYRESDELGGDDPYSASKASADLAVQSWKKSFATTPVAIARAGNVIGGGDWSEDRIIPDLVDAYSNGKIPLLRFPNAIRPWQHVLDCLNGYLILVQSMLDAGTAGEWNFGPEECQNQSVAKLTETFANFWGVEGDSWNASTEIHPQESQVLLLNSDKSRSELGWRGQLDFLETVSWTVDWYKAIPFEGALGCTNSQISKFYSELQ